MGERERRLWQMTRRGLLLIAKGIEREGGGGLWRDVRRGLLLIAEAIERETKEEGVLV